MDAREHTQRDASLCEAWGRGLSGLWAVLNLRGAMNKPTQCQVLWENAAEGSRPHVVHRIFERTLALTCD